jgi:hypothetical protein
MGFGLVQGCFLQFGLAGALFGPTLGLKARSGSWNPEVNDFGISAPPFRLGSDGLRPGQGCFLSLGRPLPTFQQDGHFSLKSRSWNPEVNSFGFKSRLFWAVSWNLGSFCPQARFGGLRAGISAILGREQLISAFSAVAT